MLSKIIAFLLAFFLGITPAKPLPTSTPILSPTPTATPKPLTFTEMNKLYGPCAYLPVLMYHHIQTKESAVEKKQTALTVYTDVFRSQMVGLKARGYTSVLPSDLTAFFDQGIPLPKKSFLITFDDGYADFYSEALPVLREVGFRAVVFLPTGLINNYGYLNWSEIGEAAGQGIYFANHTWSHKNAKTAKDILMTEIVTADTQLNEHGLNANKVFAYPYGFSSANAESELSKLNYSLAFTTLPGSVLCKQKRYDLPRSRIGNTPNLTF